jgi:hypothetical protein
MEYSKLVSVTGLSGLFELLSSKSDGGIVRSLEDKSTKFVSTRLHSFSQLESIEIFTTGENVNLVEIFTSMKNHAEALPDGGDAAKNKAYFQKVYPAMDFDRVYASDMKKIIKWFAQLQKFGIEIKLSELGPDAESNPMETMAQKPKGSEPKASATKTAPPKKINAPRKMA